MVYYNEIDPFAAEWLRNLIRNGLIAPGYVDERSVEEVRPNELMGYTQCHFFAGIGGWSYALRLAGWPDDRPVWTGSPPCQPFSYAGKGRGFSDERHLWPAWLSLIEQCRPAVIFGEQVEAAIRHGWLDLVQDGLEGLGYSFAAVGLPAACVGAPHIRHRLWFVAYADSEQRHRSRNIGTRWRDEHSVSGAAGQLDDTDDEGLEGLRCGHQAKSGRCGTLRPITEAGESGILEHPGSIGRNGGKTTAPGYDNDRPASERAQGEHGPGIAGAHRIHKHGTGQTNCFWRNADWLLCRDGKWRAVEPGTFPLAHGVPARVGRLRAYGNAIVPQVAAEVIRSYMLATQDRADIDAQVTGNLA